MGRRRRVAQGAAGTVSVMRAEVVRSLAGNVTVRSASRTHVRVVRSRSVPVPMVTRTLPFFAIASETVVVPDAVPWQDAKIAGERAAVTSSAVSAPRARVVATCTGGGGGGAQRCVVARQTPSPHAAPGQQACPIAPQATALQRVPWQLSVVPEEAA